MKRAFILPVIFMVIAMAMAFPASPAAAGGGAAPAAESGPLFSLAPATDTFFQASPGSPVISGAARNEQGAAIPGVVVNAENPSTHAVVASAATNATGSYSLAVPAGTYDVKAIPPPASGLTAGTYRGVAVSADLNLDILFVPADMVTFSGRLLDRSGTPIPNQTVSLKRTPFGKTATTDDQGRFSVKIPPGDYTLDVVNGLFVVPPNVPSSYQVTGTGTISVTGNTSRDITLNQVYLTGKVTDSVGLVPVAGAIVHASGNTSFGTFSGRFDTYATTDLLGNYSAVIFPCSSLTIEATPPEMGDLGIYAYEKVEGVSALGDTTRNIRCGLSVTFSGKVLDRDGDPIYNQSVTLKKTGFSKGSGSEEDGSFSVKVPTGTYSIEVANGFLSSAPNAPNSYKLTRNSTVTLLLGAIMNLTVSEVYLTGKAVNAAGQAVPNVQLHFSASGTFGSYAGSFDSYAISDSAGNYSAVILPTSSLTVEATPPDTSAYAYTKVEGLSVTADGARNITLANAVNFSGRLLDRDGDPIPGQILILKKTGYSMMGGTDTEGRFSFNLPAGDYSLEVLSGFFAAPTNVPSSYQLAKGGTVSLTADTAMNITLSEAYIKGKVVGPGDAAVSGVELAMSGSGTWGDLSGTFDCRRVSDGQGDFNAVVFPSSMTLQTTPPEATGYGPGQAVGVGAAQDKSMLVILCERNDVTPPRAVDNLAVTAAYDISAALSWTAPGDNAAYGTASSYDIRYSTSPITDANWGAAVQCVGEPAPGPAGQPESFLVTGLSPGTTYYFAMKTADEVPNWSGLSNVVQATTGAFVNLTVTSITPGNVLQFSWFVDLEITGTGFQPGAKVELRMSDTVIGTSNVNVVSENKITCTALILAQSPGAYDVVVINPGGKEARLIFGLWIGVSCGSGSAAGMVMLGMSLGLLSLADTVRRRRRRRTR